MLNEMFTQISLFTHSFYENSTPLISFTAIVFAFCIIFYITHTIIGKACNLKDTPLINIIATFALLIASLWFFVIGLLLFIIQLILSYVTVYFLLKIMFPEHYNKKEFFIVKTLKTMTVYIVLLAAYGVYYMSQTQML